MRRSTWLLLALFLAGVSPAARSQASSLAPTQLEGVRALVPYVVIGGELETSNESALRDKALQLVSRRLEDAGIGTDAKHGERLTIRVSVSRPPSATSGCWVVRTEASFGEAGELNRDSSLRVPGGTVTTWWNATAETAATSAEAESVVMSAIENGIDRFLTDWSSANSK